MVHNDDISMRVLRLARERSDERAPGGIVSAILQQNPADLIIKPSNALILRAMPHDPRLSR